MKRTRALLGIATGLGLIASGAPAQAAPPEPFTFTFNAEGELVEGLSGKGRIIDVCAQLA